MEEKKLYNDISCFSLLKKHCLSYKWNEQNRTPIYIGVTHVSTYNKKEKSIKMKLLNYKSSLLFIWMKSLNRILINFPIYLVIFYIYMIDF
jgi:hypothetical protein